METANSTPSQERSFQLLANGLAHKNPNVVAMLLVRAMLLAGQDFGSVVESKARHLQGSNIFADPLNSLPVSVADSIVEALIKCSILPPSSDQNVNGFPVLLDGWKNDIKINVSHGRVISIADYDSEKNEISRVFTCPNTLLCLTAIQLAKLSHSAGSSNESTKEQLSAAIKDASDIIPSAYLSYAPALFLSGVQEKGGFFEMKREIDDYLDPFELAEKLVFALADLRGQARQKEDLLTAVEKMALSIPGDLGPVAKTVARLASYRHGHPAGAPSAIALTNPKDANKATPAYRPFIANVPELECKHPLGELSFVAYRVKDFSDRVLTNQDRVQLTATLPVDELIQLSSAAYQEDLYDVAAQNGFSPEEVAVTLITATPNQAGRVGYISRHDNMANPARTLLWSSYLLERNRVDIYSQPEAAQMQGNGDPLSRTNLREYRYDIRECSSVSSSVLLLRAELKARGAEVIRCVAIGEGDQPASQQAIHSEGPDPGVM